MSATLRTQEPLSTEPRGHAPAWAVALCATVVVLLRLPLLGHAASADEGGYLVVAGQWNGAGSSLYTDYWVDRPPLLITIFRVAALLGGVPALRVIGCVAAALLVLGSAAAAASIAGRRAACWAAGTAAVLSLSPLLGTYQVDGELLAAPLVVLGITAGVAGLRTDDDRRAIAAACAAGALGVSAMLVKQNVADVVVFCVVAALLARRAQMISARHARRLAGAFAAGAVAVAVVIGCWTVAHGTDVGGVVDAMYPFRVRAGRVLAAAGPAHAASRRHLLVSAALVSGLVPLVVVAAGGTVVDRPRDLCRWALIATVGFGILSVALGGNYWQHYLVQLIGPVSIAVGCVAARRRVVGVVGVVLAFAVVSAVVGWTLAMAAPRGSVGSTVGAAVASSARHRDTIVTAYGHADVVQSSGLESPYPQLWSLPIKTLDPRLTSLDRVLAGPDAPTYLVVWGRLGSWGLSTGPTSVIVGRDYHLWARICGRRVYLRNTVERRAPLTPAGCGASAPYGPR